MVKQTQLLDGILYQASSLSTRIERGLTNMKELEITRTINTGNYENVKFTATFERHESIVRGHTLKETEDMLIKRAFEEFDLIIKRAGLNDMIQWVKPEVPTDLADKIDAALEENKI